MAIPIATNFKNNTNLPLDAYTVFENMTDLMKSEWRKEGVLVYIKDEDKHYYWNGMQGQYVEYTGQPGAPGEQGLSGADGATGAVGLDGLNILYSSWIRLDDYSGNMYADIPYAGRSIKVGDLVMSSDGIFARVVTAPTEHCGADETSGSTASVVILGNLKGADGADGTDGRSIFHSGPLFGSSSCNATIYDGGRIVNIGDLVITSDGVLARVEEVINRDDTSGTAVSVIIIGNLKGATGQQGPPGTRGEQGQIGYTGSSGPQGAEGQSIFYTTSPLHPANGVPSDIYRNTINVPSGRTIKIGDLIVSMNNGRIGDVFSISSTVVSVYTKCDITGPQGPMGATGYTGAQGVSGDKGGIGPTGQQGPVGDTGAPGAQGAEGLGIFCTTSSLHPVNGFITNNIIIDVPLGRTVKIGDIVVSMDNGRVGDIFNISSQNGISAHTRGDIIGPIGPQGTTGATGLPGQQGPQGNPGPVGDTGSPGIQGSPGQAGQQGPVGDTGAPGAQGAEGLGIFYTISLLHETNGGTTTDVIVNVPTGRAIKIGDIILSTDNGHIGIVYAVVAYNRVHVTTVGNITGATGLQGATGDTGSPGIQGSPGTPGQQGPVGDTGAHGAQGPPGQPGQTGAEGLSVFYTTVSLSTSISGTTLGINPNVPSGRTAKIGDIVVSTGNGRIGSITAVASQTSVTVATRGNIVGEWDSILNKPMTFPPSTHPHNEYASTGHSHSDYSSSVHTHNYAPTSHNHEASNINSGTLNSARIPLASRTTIGGVKATSPDGSGVTTLGTGQANIATGHVVSFNNGDNTENLNNFRTVGEWYFYRTPSSSYNDPPFSTGGTGIYLKVLHGYSNTYCIQLCWRRSSTEMYIRYATSTTSWSAWLRIANEDDLDWDSIKDKPVTFPPNGHTHSALDINSGKIAIDRIPTGYASNTVSLGNHTHDYASFGHSHSDYALTSHNHDVSNINSGTLAIARIPTGSNSNTVALGNHTHPAQTSVSGDAWTTSFTPTNYSSYSIPSAPPNLTGREHFGYLYSYAEYLNTKEPNSHSHTAQTTVTGAAWTSAFTPTNYSASNPPAAPGNRSGAEHFGMLYSHAEYLNNNKASANHTHSDYASTGHSHDWDVIQDKPSSFPPASHMHSYAPTNHQSSSTSYGQGTKDWYGHLKQTATARTSAATSDTLSLGSGFGQYALSVTHMGSMSSVDLNNFTAHGDFLFYSVSTRSNFPPLPAGANASNPSFCLEVRQFGYNDTNVRQRLIMRGANSTFNVEFTRQCNNGTWTAWTEKVGPTGPPGAQGSTGPQGATGAKGATGYTGAPGKNGWYGTCATSGGTSAKVVPCTDFVREIGSTITILFYYANTATYPSLNVNNTGAGTIVYRNNSNSAYNAAGIPAGLNTFIWDGSYWMLQSCIVAVSGSSGPPSQQYPINTLFAIY